MSAYEQVQQHLKEHQHTWLVTGVAGFIGSNLLEKLLILNQKVIGLDNFETGYRHNLDQAIEDAAKATGNAGIGENFQFIEGDIRQLDDCQKACEGVDYVLHQAALGSVPRSIEDPIRTNKANIDGFLNMLVAARDANVKRFVYAASSSTYGDHPDLPKVEENIGKPMSPYAVTKVVNELYADVFAKTYGLHVIGLRYFNVFGKRQDPEGAYAAVIPKWVSAMLDNEEIFINGDGETSRDFCYIENTIQMNILSATAGEEAKNQVYNVAVGGRTTLNDLFTAIKEGLSEKNSDIKNIEPTYRDFRAGDVRHSQADISKGSKLLNYQPTHSITQGLEEALEWYVKNHNIAK